jgi:hypothetical protein
MHEWDPGSSNVPSSGLPALDEPPLTLYNLHNHTVRSRLPGTLVEKDGPG